ncbi:MAG: pilus assembly protein TadG [Alphaproteobacteria bacterium PA2]|nr:MAG: pilus assembly protein TadG [Alphaproteobacteria bacterium PA2]
MSAKNTLNLRARLQSGLQGFMAGRRSESGAVAVMFALSLLVLTPMVLGAVDTYQNNNQRGQLQDALDAATLFAARSRATTTEGVDLIGDTALKANLILPEGSMLIRSDFVLTPANTVEAVAEVTPAGIAPGLWPHPNLRAGATVTRAVDRLEVALVLDNTGSMSGTKISTLKVAAKNLIDTLQTASQRSTEANPLKISLTPFSMTVRVQGTTQTNTYDPATHSGPGIPGWLDPQGVSHARLGAGFDIFDVQTDRFALLKQMNNTPWEGCVEARPRPYDIQDTAPSAGSPDTLFIPFFWPDEPDASAGFYGYPNDYLSDGVTSPNWQVREQNSAKYVTAPAVGRQTGSGYQLGPNGGCSLQPMIRLTSNFAALKSAIDGMVAVGDTNIPLGLMWGWHTLSPNAPLSDGAAYGTENLRKVIILMTDGENTMGDPGSNSEQNRSYYSGLGYIWQGLLGIFSGSSSTRTQTMDARLSALCQNIKGKDITLFTVRVEVRSGASSVLQNCASSRDKYYDVQDVSQLSAAFEAIAGSIDTLHISH